MCIYCDNVCLVISGLYWSIVLICLQVCFLLVATKLYFLFVQHFKSHMHAMHQNIFGKELISFFVVVRLHRLTLLWFTLMRKTCWGWLFWQLLWCATWHPSAENIYIDNGEKKKTHFHFSHQNHSAQHTTIFILVVFLVICWCIFQLPWCNLIYFKVIYANSPFLFDSI